MQTGSRVFQDDFLTGQIHSRTKLCEYFGQKFRDSCFAVCPPGTYFILQSVAEQTNLQVRAATVPQERKKIEATRTLLDINVTKLSLASNFGMLTRSNLFYVPFHCVPIFNHFYLP